MSEAVEQPAELVDLQGAWRRDGRTVNSGEWLEVSDVLWLQAGNLFCDLRTPLPGTSSTNLLDVPQAFSARKYHFPP